MQFKADGRKRQWSDNYIMYMGLDLAYTECIGWSKLPYLRNKLLKEDVYRKKDVMYNIMYNTENVNNKIKS